MVGLGEGKAIGTLSKLEVIFLWNGFNIQSAYKEKNNLKSALFTPKVQEIVVGRPGVAEAAIQTES